MGREKHAQIWKSKRSHFLINYFFGRTHAAIDEYEKTNVKETQKCVKTSNNNGGRVHISNEQTKYEVRTSIWYLGWEMWGVIFTV